MSAFIAWLEAHDKLSGWAQFAGAMIALALTYFLGYAPIWRRNRQLKVAAVRLLSHGYEALESYHRTSGNFLPFPLSLRSAALSMNSMAGEIERFPVYELEDQGSRSDARSLVAISAMLKNVALFLDSYANEIDEREGTEEDQDVIREFVGNQLKLVETILSGKELKRPEWPIREG